LGARPGLYFITGKIDSKDLRVVLERMNSKSVPKASTSRSTAQSTRSTRNATARGYFSDDDRDEVDAMNNAASTSDLVVDRIIRELGNLGPENALFNKIVDRVKSKIQEERADDVGFGSCGSRAGAGSGFRRSPSREV